MEEHSFDPVRAVASLSPASLLCPSGALRVLGSGFIGVVFLEEEGLGAVSWMAGFPEVSKESLPQSPPQEFTEIVSSS